MDTSALLLQLLAGRMGSGADPAAGQLLAAMGKPGGTAGPDLKALLDGLGDQNPAARLLAQHLAEQEARRAESPPERGGSGEDLEAHLAAVEALRAHAEAVEEELRCLRGRVEELAFALGACPLCWGDDPACRSCRGRGRPGHACPDGRAFRTYVVPAARMWRAQRLQERGGVVRTPVPGGRSTDVPAGNEAQRS
jgi:hypothetical protein